MARFLSNIIVLLLLGALCRADVGPTKLQAVIHESDLIVLGEVVSVKVLDDGFKLAKVRIDQTIRGTTQKSILYYIASPITPEDVSKANVGETAVLFLRKLRKSPADYPANLAEATGGDPVYLVAAAGRGRLVPVLVGNDRVVKFNRNRGIILPAELLSLWKPDENQTDVGFVKLDDLLEFIKHQAN